MGGPPKVTRERVRLFWRARIAGALMAEAAAVAGVSEASAARWVADSGGMICDLDEPSGRYLCQRERELLAEGLAQGLAQNEIARRLGRDKSTISRELSRNRIVRRPAVAPRPDGRPHPRGPKAGTNRGRDRSARERLRYSPSHAQYLAERRARRRTPGKLAGNLALHAEVSARLVELWSPEQIAATLTQDFPDRPEMRVSHETIYKALYVQGRGELRRELTKCLRTGRALRKPRRIPGEQRGKRQIPAELMIANRPAEADDRAVPGHWEGDLITGAYNKSAIATLVERTSRTVLLAHLPAGDHGAEAVRDALTQAIHTLPEQLRRSLTWDQGAEMACHAQITLATNLDIYFCDPHSPWQRGSNENTNGLLRQYFGKGTDLSVHTPEHLTAVAAQLNKRPRKTLGWKTPAQRLNELLSSPPTTNGVATTP